MIIKYGKGKGKSFSFDIGMYELKLTKRMLNLTIRQIADELARQYEIKNGNINLNSINFMTYKNQE